MNTYREIVYMILDLIKLMSDDAYYNEEHVLYLVDKYRMFVLDKKYANKDYDIPLFIDNAYGLPWPNIIFTEEATPYWDSNVILSMSLSKIGLPTMSKWLQFAIIS